MYRIRNGKGLYSTGGVSPRWVGEEGAYKVWTNKRHLAQHLRLIKKNWQGEIPLGWVIERLCVTKTLVVGTEEVLP